MTIEEFEQLLLSELKKEDIEFTNYILGIEKVKDKAVEYNCYIITESKRVTGIHSDPLKSILKAIFQL
jgi:hypothetical protein